MAEILELKNTSELTKVFSEWNKEKEQLFDIDAIPVEISTMEKIDIYNAIQNERVRQNYFDHYGEEKIKNLVDTLTDKQKEIANIMIENVQDYDKLNSISIEFYQKDLRKVGNYWPATSEHKTDIDLFNTYSGGSSNNVSAMKERALGNVKPLPNNAYSKLLRHIDQVSYMTNMAQTYKQLDSLFLSPEVKKMVVFKFGDSIYNSFRIQIEDLGFSKRNEFLGDYSKLIQKATGNWIVAKIASPSVFVKQILSVGNYSEEVNTIAFVKNFSYGISHPKETIDYMKKNAPFLEERYKNGFNEAIKRSMEASKLSKLQTNFTNISTFLTRIGDIGSIIFGGYGEVKSLIESGMSEAEAFKKFQQDTIRSQQSGLNSSISGFQKSSNPLTRLFFAFKNTPLQYMRKINDTFIMYKNGDIDIQQASKTLLLYGVIAPALNVAVSPILQSLYYLGYDDEDDNKKKRSGNRNNKSRKNDNNEFKEIASNTLADILISPLGGVPILESMSKSLTKSFITDNILDNEGGFNDGFSFPVLDDLEKMLAKAEKINSKGLKLEDLMSIIIGGGEIVTGLPLHNINKIQRNFTNKDLTK